MVRAQEPTSARPGDRAIILADGSIEGFVGGHCAAGSVRTAALDALGLGREHAAAGAAGRRRRLPRLAGGERGGEPVPVGRALEIYLEPLLPTPFLHLVGTSPVADAVAGAGARRSASSSTAAPRPSTRRGRPPRSSCPATVATRSGEVRAALDGRGRLRRGRLQPHPGPGAAGRARPSRPRRRLGCTCTWDSTSAHAPRRRWGCRSWPPSSAGSGSTAWRRPHRGSRRRPLSRPSTRSAG